MEFKLNIKNRGQKKILLLQIVMGAFSSAFRESLRGTFLDVVEACKWLPEEESVKEKNNCSQRQ